MLSKRALAIAKARSYADSIGFAFRRFAAERRGNVLIMFALLVVPMLGSLGLAVDFGKVLTARNEAQTGADAAVLQASGMARELIKGSDGGVAATNAAFAEAKTRAKAMFGAYALQYGLDNYSVAIDVVTKDKSIFATVEFSVTVKNSIGRLFGQESFTAKGVATSASSLPSYVDVYLAMDVSQSMGIAATNADMIKLYDATPVDRCVFGCHVAEHTDKEPRSNEKIAADIGATLRIDVVRSAAKTMIETAKSGSPAASIYRFGLYTMGLAANTSRTADLGELSPITGNYTSLLAQIPNIKLGWNSTAGYGDSFINEQMTKLNGKISASGDGTSQAKSRKYVFLITDGARDVNTPDCWPWWGHCMNPVDTAVCAAMKNKDITVGVLYTTYLPVYADARSATTYDGRYQGLLVNTGVAPKIAPALKSCASNGWYFEAADKSGIEVAMRAMFAQTSDTPAALTQ